MMQWHTAERAAGRGVSGFVKCVAASFAPRPEFCMPTSMETVRASRTLSPQTRAIMYPMAKPIPCMTNTACSRLPAESETAFFWPPTMAPTIRMMKKMLTSGVAGSIFFTKAPKK